MVEIGRIFKDANGVKIYLEDGGELDLGYPLYLSEETTDMIYRDLIKKWEELDEDEDFPNRKPIVRKEIEKLIE